LLLALGTSDANLYLCHHDIRPSKNNFQLFNFNIFLAKTCFTAVIKGLVMPLSNRAFVMFLASWVVILRSEINMFVIMFTTFHI